MGYQAAPSVSTAAPRIRNQVQPICNLLIAFWIALGIIKTVSWPWSDTHGKQDEQSAKLQRVLPADLSVDGGRADES